VACPYFYPTEEVDFAARPRPARAPLGTIYQGVCHARTEAVIPTEGLIYEPCNFGYGRGSCPWFPADASADAVHFTEFRGGVIFILEKDHVPVEHGRCGANLLSHVRDRQATVFAQSKCQNK
jgi:hypothetical protein